MNRQTKLFAFLSPLLIAAAAFAQSGTGSLSGTITDPNGAAVSGAAVEAKEEATGRLYKTKTTEAGVYVLPTLPVGMYSITAEQPGFKKSVQTDVEVRVALRATVDARWKSAMSSRAWKSTPRCLCSRPNARARAESSSAVPVHPSAV